MTKHSWAEKDKNEILFRSSGFWWKVDPELADEYISLSGPLCRKKSCVFQLEILKKDEQSYFHCAKCQEEYKMEDDFNFICEFARRDYIANRRKGLKAINLDKLPSINEELREDDKYFRVSVERDSGKLKDIHIIIGKRKNNGKKAHIILSEDGEIRIDKKDLHPSEEIKSITSIIYK